MVSTVKNGRRVIVGGATAGVDMLFGTTEITQAISLNTLTTPDNYFKEQVTFAVTDAPDVALGVTSKFRLTVEKGLGIDSSIIKQTIDMVDGDKYFRIYDGTAWGEWEDASSVGPYVPVVFEIDFNTGELMYRSVQYTFEINTTTGELEWEEIAS